eukprot:10390879-Alexandrium_andersonii.AAC.1
MSRPRPRQLERSSPPGTPFTCARGGVASDDAGPQARRGRGVQLLGRGHPQATLLASAHGGDASDGLGAREHPCRGAQQP